MLPRSVASYNVSDSEPWRDALPVDARGTFAVLEGLQAGTPYQIEARARAPACDGGRLESGPVTIVVWTLRTDARPPLACPSPNVTTASLDCILRGGVRIVGALMPNISDLAGLDPGMFEFRQWPPPGTLLVPAYANVTNPAYELAVTASPDVERRSLPQLDVGGVFARINGSEFLVLGCSCSGSGFANDSTVPIASDVSLATLAAPNGTVTLSFEYNATDACEEPVCEVGVVVLDDGRAPAGSIALDRDGRALAETMGLGVAPAAEVRMGGDGSLPASTSPALIAGCPTSFTNVTTACAPAARVGFGRAPRVAVVGAAARTSSSLPSSPAA
eukprot:tig00001239_g7761.t1